MKYVRLFASVVGFGLFVVIINFLLNFLFLLLMLALSPCEVHAAISGPGFFISSGGCTENSSPVANKSVCWDSAAQTVKFWNGSSWVAASGGGGGGNVSSVSASTPIASTGGTTPVISFSGATGVQGNGAKVQLSTGATTTNDLVKYDANGNTVDSGSAGGGGSSFPINSAPAQTGNYNAQGFKLQNIGQASIMADALGWGQAALVTSLTGSVNNVINPMEPTYGAKCDGTTDDTTAIQNASNFAFSNGKRLLIPGICRVTSLNWTNRQTGQVQVVGLGQDISKLLCRESAFNTAVCVDMTDTERAVLKDFSILSEGAGASGSCAASTICAPKITLLISETVFSPGVNSQIYNLDGVKIDNIGTDAASAGSYALYAYGAEIFQASHFYFRGGTVDAARFTVDNGAGVTSPFRGTLAAAPTSMTTVSLSQGLVDARGTSAWGITLEAASAHMVSDFSMDHVYGNTPGGGFIQGLGAGTIHTLTLNNVRYEPQGGATSIFGQFAEQVENVEMLNDTFAAITPPTVAILQFNKSGVVSVAGGRINLRPSDTQGNYPAGTVVSCASGAAGVEFDSVDASGGGPLNISGCPGMAELYRSSVFDPFLYNGSGASAIPACGATYASTERWVSDGVTGCTYNSAYAAGAGTAKCKVGCPSGGSSWLYGF